MVELKWVKAPGFVYDLFFTFFLHFNKERCMEEYVNGDKKKEDCAFYNRVLEVFPPVSNDLFLFFHAAKNGRCFMTTEYLMRYKDRFVQDYDPEFLMSELSDSDELMRRLIAYYFPFLAEQEVAQLAAQPGGMLPYIKGASYSDEEKARLYEFFIDPVPCMDNLRTALRIQIHYVQTYYEEQYAELSKLMDTLTFDTLCQQLKPLEDISFVEKEDLQMYVSPCVLNKISLNFCPIDVGLVYLLGRDYADEITYLCNKKAEVSLESFGVVIGDRSRLGILELIMERGEICCKDVEYLFDFSGSTAYHHLTTMVRAGALSTHNRGRTVLYSIRKGYFDAAINTVGEYAKRAKEREQYEETVE